MGDKENAPNIIDNSPDRELVLVIKDLLKKSKEAKFAIGYFFLSGFSLVKDDFPNSYDNLPFLKIVMGNETTYPTKEELVEGYNLREEFKRRMIEDLQRLKPDEERIAGLNSGGVGKSSLRANSQIKKKKNFKSWRRRIWR